MGKLPKLGIQEVLPALVLCYGEKRFINSGVSFCLLDAAAVWRPQGKSLSPCLTRKQNVQLRTWGIRKKENIVNSKSSDRIAVRVTSK